MKLSAMVMIFFLVVLLSANAIADIAVPKPNIQPPEELTLENLNKLPFVWLSYTSSERKRQNENVSINKTTGLALGYSQNKQIGIAVYEITNKFINNKLSDESKSQALVFIPIINEKNSITIYKQKNLALNEKHAQMLAKALGLDDLKTLTFNEEGNVNTKVGAMSKSDIEFLKKQFNITSESATPPNSAPTSNPPANQGKQTTL